MTTKRCWTCKDRKVSCDQIKPACQRCLKSKRTCAGYGLRLTWKNEKLSPGKRLPGEYHHYRGSRNAPIHFVNIGYTDLELHLAAITSDGRARGFVSRDHFAIANPPLTSLTSSPSSTGGDMVLISYFDRVVTHILPVLGSSRERIRHTIMQTALSRRTAASHAVYLSMLALSSYHLGNDPDRTQRTQERALRTLLRSAESEMDACSGIAHIAAGMLLCIVAVQRAPHEDLNWVGHLCGAQSVVRAVSSTCYAPGSDAAIILDWLFYLDTMGRFSSRHWRTDSVLPAAVSLGFTSSEEERCALQFLIARRSFARALPDIKRFAHPLVSLLERVFHTLMYASEEGYASAEYQEELVRLREELATVNLEVEEKRDAAWKDVTNLPVPPYIAGRMEVDGAEKITVDPAMQLTRLAAQIYLHRISLNLSGASPEIEAWTAEGLKLLEKTYTLPSSSSPSDHTATNSTTTLSSFTTLSLDEDIPQSFNAPPPSFTLLILALECTSDTQRHILLSTLQAITSGPHLGTVRATRGIIEGAWAQQDLSLASGMGVGVGEGSDGEASVSKGGFEIVDEGKSVGLGYIGLVNLVVSAQEWVPGFM